MKIVIAPGTFKGSATAAEAADSMALGIRRAFPDAEIVLAPIGDGGEGTAEALMRAMPNSRIQTTIVTGPTGAPVHADFVLLGENGESAALDMASAAGLLLIAKDERNPMRCTTYGVGQLIISVVETEGIEHLIIGLGGSATNDGGAGCLQALGFEFSDENGRKITERLVPKNLATVCKMDGSRIDPRLRRIPVTIACDVDNPLTGPRGASRVFGPQKGATPEMVEALDRALIGFGTVLDSYAQSGGSEPVSSRHGAGAAGGLGAALMTAFPQALIEPGIDVVLDAVGFDKVLTGADLVLTGEGKLDSQTLGGKAIHGVLRRAAAQKVPVIAIAGAADQEAAAALAPMGLQGAIQLVDLAGSVAAAMNHALRFIADAAEMVVKTRF